MKPLNPVSERSLKLFVLAALVAGLTAVAARAAPVASLGRVDISPEAIAADPGLANYECWDLRVTIDPGFDWAHTGFDLVLTQGSFYNSPLGGDIPHPHLWAAFPQLRYDTFITQAADPNDPTTFEGPIIQSAYPELPIRPPIFDQTHISIIYAFTSGHRSGPGTFTVARLTVTEGAFGPMFGEHDQIERIGGDQEVKLFELVLPEPGFALPATAALLLLRRRRNGASRGLLAVPAAPLHPLTSGALAFSRRNGASMCRRVTVVLILILSLMSAATRAVPTASLVQVPITPAAIAADPVLANHQTWDLRVSIDPGRYWFETAFRATLLQGSFYNSPLGGTGPNPNAWGGVPQLRFDTFVTQAAIPEVDKTFRSPAYLGSFPVLLDPIIFSDTVVAVDYAFTPGIISGPGTFTVARLTFTEGAIGTITGFNVQSDNVQVPFALSIPEPACALLLSVLGVVSLRRQRRCPCEIGDTAACVTIIGSPNVQE